MKHLIKHLYIAVVILLVCGCGQKKSENEPEEHGHEEEQHETGGTSATLTPEQIKEVGITFGSIEQKQLTASIQANGFLRVPNDRKASATALFGGVIKTLNVQLGDNVRKGQVIATISNPQFVQLQEDYLTINSQLLLAEQEMRRQNELFEGNAGAKKNLQSASATLSALKTRKASLRKQIQLMGVNPDGLNNGNLRTVLTVVSPISGTISNITASIGSYVDVSSPVAEIVDNESLHLDLQIFEKDLLKVKEGQMVHFTLTNNPEKTYDAKIFSIGTSFENDSKTIDIHCKVTGNVDGLIDGMNVTGIIATDNIFLEAVPNDALVEADGSYYIFIRSEAEKHVHKEGEEHEHEHDTQDGVTFEKVEVAKGISNLGYTAITPVKKLPGDVVVVTKGAFFINAKLSNSGGHAH